jgi:hypothetical protein
MDDESISDRTEECLKITVSSAKSMVKEKQFLPLLYSALNPKEPKRTLSLNKEKFSVFIRQIATKVSDHEITELFKHFAGEKKENDNSNEEELV